ncbi:peptide deformylase [Bradyrhizobium tropiciagri]|uniref:peptide deformylase n=1 Tax=Bradyrhizobium tropiciagri TaxID=312253 RepID=UPI001BAD9344|nr:peptide deformylase [Bradyrhizobium tropiciagri]MBR0898864.1 peptide deformylase [Bradyrhizobium tropiciagri]
MARLNILQFPDARLRTVAEPVTYVDDAVRDVVLDMSETMYGACGIGLAATQVNVHRQIITADVSDGGNQLHVLINPVVVDQGGSAALGEGCLSIPDIFAKVNRAAWVTVRALDIDGKSRELSADGLLAMCIQHEMDHLQGTLFIDYLPDRVRRRLNGVNEVGSGTRKRRR